MKPKFLLQINKQEDTEKMRENDSMMQSEIDDETFVIKKRPD